MTNLERLHLLLVRDDYCELAETALVVLGGSLPKNKKITWYRPGATHKARFMAFGIYANKMFCFLEQLDLSKDAQAALKRFVTFSVLVYIPHFLKSSIGVDSPVDDLDVYKKLFKFRKVDHELAEKAILVLERHGWYLVEQIIPFALFCNKIDQDLKSQIAAKMLTFSPLSAKEIGKPTFPEIRPETTLPDLVGQKSYLFFDILGIDYSWLNRSPEFWHEELEYKRAEMFARTVKTVNDCAERGVKLISDYASVLTKNENMREWLLQGVEQNRRKYPDFKIKTLNK